MTSPTAGDAFYATDAVMVSWEPHDDIAGSITCEVEARGATVISIDAAIGATSDQPSTTSWTPTGVAPGDYQIAVTCTDAMSRMASATSATFTITPPPRDVSFAGELQPILTASCTSASCHDNTQPQQGLKLTAGSAYASLVGVASTQCGSLQLVAPNAPADSYLIDKLVGSNAGGCFIGLRMPKLAAALPASQVQAFRDWIANGAPNN